MNWVPDNINKVSLATSFGVSKIPRKYSKNYKDFLSRINHISTRELSGLRIIEDLIGKKVNLACDPIFLLTPQEWDKIQSKTRMEKEKYTRVDHPLLICDFIKENSNLPNEDIELVTKMISSHMGIWNTDFNGNEVLPIPKDKYQRFVHMCDFLASRKFLNVNLYESEATTFKVKNETEIYPPFNSIDGLGDTVAKNLVAEREKREFLSIEEVQTRAKVSQTLIEKMRQMGIFDGLIL